MSKRKYTIDNQLKQLKKKYTAFRKARQDFRGFVYFLRVEDKRSFISIGDQIGYTKAGVRRIVNHVENEMKGGKTS